MENKVYKTDDTYCISDGGGWLPGNFDSEEAAAFAFSLPYDKLRDLSNAINNIQIGNRNINLWDIKDAEPNAYKCEYKKVHF